MAFVRVSEILRSADKANTSVIGFNCSDYNTVCSVVTAAEKVEKPVICMLYPEHVYLNNTNNLSGFAATVRELAEGVGVPVGLHLDHSSDFAFIVKAIKAGFTSVMYDGSMLELEENIANSKKVVEIAHLFGVSVEAEIGHVGMAEQLSEVSADHYTKPETIAYFAEETGVDSIAVAIGSAHGTYLTTPQLDLERLDELNKATDVPLVLHGGSGIPSKQLDEAFKRGINKFNVGTEFLDLWKESTHKHMGNLQLIPVEVAKMVQSDLVEYLVKKLELTKM